MTNKMFAHRHDSPSAMLHAPCTICGGLRTDAIHAVETHRLPITAEDIEMIDAATFSIRGVVFVATLCKQQGSHTTFTLRRALFLQDDTRYRGTITIDFHDSHKPPALHCDPGQLVDKEGRTPMIDEPLHFIGITY